VAGGELEGACPGHNGVYHSRTFVGARVLRRCLVFAICQCIGCVLRPLPPMTSEVVATHTERRTLRALRSRVRE
jgi:hypothetical protein